MYNTNEVILVMPLKAITKQAKAIIQLRNTVVAIALKSNPPRHKHVFCAFGPHLQLLERLHTRMTKDEVMHYFPVSVATSPKQTRLLESFALQPLASHTFSSEVECSLLVWLFGDWRAR